MAKTASKYWKELLLQHLVDQQPLTTDEIDLIVEFGVAQRTDFTERLDDQWWHISHPPFPEGWTQEDQDEANGRHSGEMCLTIKETGNKICFPTHLTPCDHIRVLDRDGKELAYWDEKEWEEEPAEVMGAIMGALCSLDMKGEEK